MILLLVLVSAGVVREGLAAVVALMYITSLRLVLVLDHVGLHISLWGGTHCANEQKLHLPSMRWHSLCKWKKVAPVVQLSGTQCAGGIDYANNKSGTYRALRVVILVQSGIWRANKVSFVHFWYDLIFPKSDVVRVLCTMSTTQTGHLGGNNRAKFNLHNEYHFARWVPLLHDECHPNCLQLRIDAFN